MFLRRLRSESSSLRDAMRERQVERRGEAPVLPTVALIAELLDEFGLTHTVDDDGDVLVRWERSAIYFFRYGQQDEILQARLYLNRRFSADDRGALALLMDEWNRTRLVGKAYTILPDDGLVAICAEECHDFEHATREQIKYAVASWIDALLRFADWVDEQVEADV